MLVMAVYCIWDSKKKKRKNDLILTQVTGGPKEGIEEESTQLLSETHSANKPRLLPTQTNML